jgi:hypothetical protein
MEELIMTNGTVKGIAAIVGAVIMHFTPDHIDRIVESLLGIYGINTIFIANKRKNNF